MNGPFLKSDALVRTKRAWLFAAGTVFAVAGFQPAIFAALWAIGKGHPIGLLALVVYYGGLFGLMHLFNRKWLERRGDVRADESGLWLGEKRVVRREAVRHGHVLEREGRWYVRLGRVLRQVDIEVADRAEGEALLAAMRLDAARSVGQYPMTHGTYRGSWARAALSVLPMLLSPLLAHLLGGTIPLLLGTLLTAATLTCAYAVNQLVRVSIGADGVRVRRTLERSRFIPFSSIDEAKIDGKDITIRLRDGEILTMHHPAGRGRLPTAFVDRALEGKQLVERINQQIAAHRARANPDAPVFARAGRETEAWLRDVVAATDAHASYRSPAVPPDELWRIVEDVAAPATARAGAAVALRQVLDESGRVRLHAVADACAAPRLRVALETVATSEDDEEVLRGALDPLVDDEAPRRARAL